MVIQLASPAPITCQYCHCAIVERDLGAHYVHCHFVRLALDDGYQPFVTADNKRRASKRAAHHNNNIGPGIVLNANSARAYAAHRKQGRFAKSPLPDNATVEATNDNKEEQEHQYRKAVQHR